MHYLFAKIESDGQQELFVHYTSMALYAISNNRKMSKTFSEVQNIIEKPKETRSGKQVAEDVAKKIGIKINWQK